MSPMRGPEIIDRLKQALGVTSLDGIASALGETRGAVGSWSSRGSVPLDALVKTANIAKCTLDWLVLGGESAPSSPRPQPIQSPPLLARRDSFAVAAYIASESAPPWHGDRQANPHSGGVWGKPGDAGLTRAALLRSREAGAVRPLMLSLPVGEQGGPSEDYELIPKHVRSAAAGVGVARAGDEPDQVDLVGEMAFSFEWMRRNLGHTSGNLTSIQVRGDSMAATLLDGDTIVIDEGVEGVDVDGIYVLDVYGRRLVKRVQHLVDGTLVLISDNQSYQRESIPRDQARSVRVIGRMVWPRVR